MTSPCWGGQWVIRSFHLFGIFSVEEISSKHFLNLSSQVMIWSKFTFTAEIIYSVFGVIKSFIYWFILTSDFHRNDIKTPHKMVQKHIFGEGSLWFLWWCSASLLPLFIKIPELKLRVNKVWLGHLLEAAWRPSRDNSSLWIKEFLYCKYLKYQFEWKSYVDMSTNCVLKPAIQAVKNTVLWAFSSFFTKKVI